MGRQGRCGRRSCGGDEEGGGWDLEFTGLSRIPFIVLTLLILITSPSGEPCEHHFISKDGLEGEFTSPSFPDSYPPHSNCRYFFMGTKDERVRITWLEFDLEPGTNAGCLFDYVDIFTIDFRRMKNLEDRLCGREIPEPIVSLHLTVEINFKSDYTGTKHNGFRGHYEFIQERWQPFEHSEECGAGYFGRNIGGGVITSPLYPVPYPPNMECTWMIRVSDDRHILLNFIELDLGQSVHCGETFVKIYNGFASADKPAAENVCGQLYFYNSGVKEFKSTSFRVVIRFKSGPQESGARNRGRGFKLAWTAVKLPQIYKNDAGEYFDSPCEEFHCKGGEYCIDTSGLLCFRLPRYCIAKSLCCNGVPNCGAFDHSDEDGCFYKTILIVLGTVGPVILIGLIAGTVFFCHRRGFFKKSASQEQALTMTLQKLDRSPTSGNKRSSIDKSNGTNSLYNNSTMENHAKSPRTPKHNMCGNHAYLPPSPSHHGYHHHSPHTLRMPPGRIPAYHMVVNTDSDDNHSIHATV